MEVAPTKTMMIAEFMNRYSWMAWLTLLLSLVAGCTP